jgi:hypothetical protein
VAMASVNGNFPFLGTQWLECSLSPPPASILFKHLGSSCVVSARALFTKRNGKLNASERSRNRRSSSSSSTSENRSCDNSDALLLARNENRRGRSESLTTCNVAGVSADSANAETECKKQPGQFYGPPLRGRPLPFGASASENGVNFAVHSSGASSVCLCLFTESDLQQGKVSKEVQLDPVFNRTGDVWHIFLPDIAPNLLYGYRVNGHFSPEEGTCYDAKRVLIDPYAKVRFSSKLIGKDFVVLFSFC